MKVGIYALAKNESANVAAWEASCRDADVRVVTDTGSTDDTAERLQAAGVTVARGTPVPWRWDDAHNLSLFHLPADVDVAIRLDLDEVMEPGWRAALEADWRPETTKLRYWYAWSDSLTFRSDRCHTRAGYRWVGATHEGLVRWAGDEVQTASERFRIRHHRQPGKAHKSDLTLLRQAVRENPLDVRMQWYLARELDYGNAAEAAAAWTRYLEMPGGTPHERAYACRAMARITPAKCKLWLLRAMQESPDEPEAYLALAEMARNMGDHAATLVYARQATVCRLDARTHCSIPGAFGDAPFDMAATAASELGLWGEALAHAREAAARNPADERLAWNVSYIERIATEDGPKPD
jgi:tetratricopeptide (TPR) repeat protein